MKKNFLTIIAQPILHKFSDAQSMRLLRCCIKLSPDLVSEYSVRGGTSGYTARLITPSASSDRNVTVNIRCEMMPINLWRSLNRIVPLVASDTSTNNDHFSLRRPKRLRIGQSSDGLIFFPLNSIFITLKINNTYLRII